MNNQGFSNNNLHIGDTYIKNGDLNVDGDLIVDGIQVNSLSIDGYTLPTSAGTNGQVITMNPDNTTTSFQDVSIPTLVDQRVCLNRWFSINQREKFGASQGTILFNENDVGSAVTGHRTIGTCVIPADDIDALDENFSILTLQIRNDILNSNPVDPNQIQFYLVLTTGGITSSVQFEVMDYQGLITGTGAPLQSMLEHQIRFARSINDASKILISVKGMKPTDTTGTGNTNTDKPFASHNNLKNGAVTGDIFIFDFPQQDVNTGCYLDNYVSGNDITIDIQAERPPVAGTNIINSALVMGRLDSYIKQNLPSSGPVINDHLLLSNLNGGTGDGGHINLFDVRGIKPMTGNINMNGNDIQNVSQVNGQGGLNLMEINNTNGLMLVDGAELRLTADTSIKLYPTIDLRLGAGGSNIIINPSSEVDVQGGININNNDITNANVIVRASNGNVINFDNDVFPPLITGALTIESGAGKEININADNLLKLNGNSIIHNSGTGPHQFNDSGGIQLQMTSANIEMFKALDMKNNNINSVASLTATQVNTDTIENSGSGFLTFTNLGSYTPSFTPSALDMNLGDVNSVNNLQVASINNLTPQGGVYSGTSDGVVINNTTEQSVLPTSGVGILTIPANGFSVGDCFHCVVAGDCSFDKDDNIQIKLKENGNILAQTPIINLEDAQAGGNAFEIEIDFTIRSIGASGSIATNFDFTYNKDGIDSKDFRGTRAMDVQTIDTTVSSTLDITVQFPTNITPSSLQTKLFRLQKVF
jgi:hypothetical protein